MSGIQFFNGKITLTANIIFYFRVYLRDIADQAGFSYDKSQENCRKSKSEVFMSNRWEQILAICILVLSVFVAGLYYGYGIAIDEASKIRIVHGDSLGRLVNCHMVIGIAMLIILASQFVRGIASRVISSGALFIVLYSFWLLVQQNSLFSYYNWETWVFKFAVPIDFLIAALVVILIILSIYRTYAEKLISIPK